jgi:predicted anti-sigma-YlaC factor YlaD
LSAKRNLGPAGNQTAGSFDLHPVECHEVQTALSARSDGEPTGVDDAAADAHVRSCASCRDFAEALDAPPPVALLHPAVDPDLQERVVAAAGPVDRSGVWWVLRVMLALVAVGYLITAVPELLFSVDPHHGHIAHHLGAFEAAYAVALMFVAARPAKARAMVPFTAALAIGMLVLAVVDIARGEAFPLNELSHLLEIAGLVIVWLLATRRGWPRTSDARPPLSAAADTDRTRPRQRVG